MAPRTTKLGPGTLKIGDDTTGVDIECNLIGCRIKWNVNSDDPVTYLCGDSEPGAMTFDGELTGTMATDMVDGAASLFELSWASAGETLPFTYAPTTGVAEFAGSIVITPLDAGGDEVKKNMDSEFTWPIVGSPAEVVRTYGTPAP